MCTVVSSSLIHYSIIKSKTNRVTYQWALLICFRLSVLAGSQNNGDSFNLSHLLLCFHLSPIFISEGCSQGASAVHVPVLDEGVALKVVDMSLDHLAFRLLPDSAILQLKV